MFVDDVTESMFTVNDARCTKSALNSGWIATLNNEQMHKIILFA